VLEKLLRHAGYGTVACNGTQALILLQAATAESEPYDTVLVDSNLDAMTGLQLGTAIREIPIFDRMRLILLTSFASRTTASEISAAGFAGFVSKPVKLAELLEAVAHTYEPNAASQQTEVAASEPSAVSVRTIKDARPAFAGCVLVVDDNIVNQKVAQRFIERFGCTVTIASSGAEAVSLAAQREFDLVLMDLQMPGMDGCEAARRICENRAPPIVALSADVSGKQIEAARAAGMVDYLTKPIEQERLQSVLTKFLVQNRVIAVAS
jgi:two-component system, sensor histidine kinase and response regulator